VIVFEVGVQKMSYSQYRFVIGGADLREFPPVPRAIAGLRVTTLTAFFRRKATSRVNCGYCCQ